MPRLYAPFVAVVNGELGETCHFHEGREVIKR